jgi:hypothetical protein
MHHKSGAAWCPGVAAFAADERPLFHVLVDGIMLAHQYKPTVAAEQQYWQ